MNRRKSFVNMQLEYDRLCGAHNAVFEIEEMLKKFNAAIKSYGDEIELKKKKIGKEIRSYENDGK